MGLDDRIPLNREPVEGLSPQEIGRHAHASQPMLGCRYVDTSSTTTNCADGVATTLDLLSTAGDVKYDPYNMIDVTNNRVRIPQPGVWDISYSVIVVSVAASTAYIDLQFMQGAGTPSGFGELSFTYHPAATGDYHTMALTDTFHVPQATLGAGDLWYMRALASGAANGLKITSLSLWLRSAHIPSKF